MVVACFLDLEKSLKMDWISDAVEKVLRSSPCLQEGFTEWCQISGNLAS